MQTVADLIKEQTRSALTALAVFLSGLVYVAGLLYAGVRAYSLFKSTIDQSLLWLAVVGILALEISAVALPLALHYWTSPGLQRWAALAFYIVDLALIVSNSILDAAHHSGAIVPEFFNWYGSFALPSIPALCMAGWALVWALDNTAVEEDAKAAVRSATRRAVYKHMIEASKSDDINQTVKDAAKAEAEALVHETLRSDPRRRQPVPQARQVAPAQPAALEAPQAQQTAPQATVAGQGAIPDDMADTQPVVVVRPIPELSEPVRQRRNGHKAAGPKA